jgi:hypothetical protein
MYGTVKKFVVGGALLFGCSLISCDESLPPRDLQDFLSPVFRAEQAGEVFFSVQADTFLYGSGQSFAVGLRNNSDEYLQARAAIRGTIRLSSPTDPTFHRTYEFTVPQFGVVTINPNSEFTVSVPWDQRDDSCRYVFRNLSIKDTVLGRDTPAWKTAQSVTFVATGRIQFWPNVETKDLPEFTFWRRWIFTFDPRTGFMNSRSCRQFPSF